MAVAAAVLLLALVFSILAVEARRRRQTRFGLEAMSQLLLMSVRLQHGRWVRAADEAVLLDSRPGRMRQVVAEELGRLAPVATAPGQRRPRLAGASAAASVGAGAVAASASPVGRYGALSDNLLVGGAVGVASVWDWWHVDENVFKAVEALTHEHVGNAIDLWSTVHEHHYHLGEALFTSLRGHVGEQMAAEHLAQAGLSVDWPGASNQAGWDLGVDNHVMNVKVTANATSTLSAHFDKYPHIPALVNVDASHIPHDAIMFDPSVGIDPSALVGDHLTLVDQALSLHEAGSAVHDAFGADVLGDAHIPVIGVLVTVVRSGMREGKLVSTGDTDRARAMKNVAVDAAARGGGVMAGGAAGAAAGAHVDLLTGGLTMGLGTVIGGIAGAIAGAMGGSAAASHVRHAPLREAQESTKAALEVYGAAVEKQQKAVTKKAQHAQAEATEAMRARAQLAEQHMADELASARAQVAAGRAFDAEAVLEASTRDLQARCQRLDAHVVTVTDDVPLAYLHRALQRRLEALDRRAQRLAPVASAGDENSEEFWDIVAASAEGDAQLRSYVQNQLGLQRTVHARCVEHAVLQAAGLDNARDVARGEVHKKVEAAHASATKTLEPLAASLERKHATYQKELRAAGVAKS